MDTALQTAKSLANLAEGREGPETNEQAALLAIAYGLIAVVEAMNSKIADDVNKISEENLDLRIKIQHLETYEGPNCKHCGSANLIPLSTRVQCPQCMKIQVVK